MLSVLVAVAAACGGCGRDGAAGIGLVASGKYSLSSPAHSPSHAAEFSGLAQAPRTNVRVDSRPPRPDTVPAAPPDSLPSSFYDDSNFVVVPALSSIPIRRDAVAVFFKRGVSQAQKAAAIEGVAGVVVGGGRSDGTVEGDYVIRLPRDSTHRNIGDAIAKLAADPSIAIAMAIQVLSIATEPTVLARGAGGRLCATCTSEALQRQGRASQSIADTLTPSGRRDSLQRQEESGGFRYVRDQVALAFERGSALSVRSAALAAVRGKLADSSSLADADRVFFAIVLPSDSTWATVDSAIAVLRRQSGVRAAWRNWYLVFDVEKTPVQALPRLCTICESDARLLQQLVPVPAPDSVPIAVLKAFRADSNLTHDDAPEMSGRYARNVVLVTFQSVATQRDRTQLLRRVGGTVLGGWPTGIGGGMYYVRIDGPGTTKHLFDVIARLKASPLVRLAVPDLLDPISPGPVRE